jgi:hypothetical protein
VTPSGPRQAERRRELADPREGLVLVGLGGAGRRQPGGYGERFEEG